MRCKLTVVYEDEDRDDIIKDIAMAIKVVDEKVSSEGYSYANSEKTTIDIEVAKERFEGET